MSNEEEVRAWDAICSHEFYKHRGRIVRALEELAQHHDPGGPVGEAIAFAKHAARIFDEYDAGNYN